jgi:hypothetical protein
MNKSADIIVRAGRALSVHLLFAALLYGFAVFFTGNFENATVAVREQYESNDVMQLLGAVQSKTVSWYFTALGASWLLAALFISIAQSREGSVRSDAEARRYMPHWTGLFILFLVTSGLSFWLQISLGNVAATLINGKYLMLAVVGFAASSLAFWMATGLAVTISLKPAVPLAEMLLPSFWNR